MKKAFKSIVVAILARQVRKLRKKHSIQVIAVVGSIGKTSTKLAIAQTLSKSRRVRYQHGNYNDIVSVPLVFFGHAMPSLFNPIAWTKILFSNSKQVRSKYPYDVVVLELGTDGPGQIEAFKKYLEVDYAVVTAIAPEHMEYFGELDNVAKEELSVAGFSKQLIYNSDLIPEKYLELLPAGSISYSLHASEADFHMANIFHSAGGYEGDIKHAGEIFLHISHEVVSETQLYSVIAASIVGNLVGLKKTEILAGLSAITPVSGRLRRLRGINNSLIIDDTYNSSPEAVRAGLDTLYKLEAPQRIALLGNMNELGNMSADAHKLAGELCDPTKLALVITIGPDANKYLAAAAEAKGCTVKKFDDPYAIGEFLQTKIEPEAVIFAKGSQNGVFAEEAIKKILADPEDANKLVRQSDYWLRRKQASFKVR